MAVDYVNNHPDILPLTTLQLMINASNDEFEDFRFGKLEHFFVLHVLKSKYLQQ